LIKVNDEIVYRFFFIIRGCLYSVKLKKRRSTDYLCEISKININQLG